MLHVQPSGVSRVEAAGGMFCIFNIVLFHFSLFPMRAGGGIFGTFERLERDGD